MKNIDLCQIFRRFRHKKLFLLLSLCLFAAVGIFFYLIYFTAYQSYTGSFRFEGSYFSMPVSIMCSSFLICLISFCALTAILFFLAECYQGHYDCLTLLFAFSAFEWLVEYSLSISSAPILSVSSGGLYLFFRKFYIIPLLFFLYSKMNLCKKRYVIPILLLVLLLVIAWLFRSPSILLKTIDILSFAMLLFTFVLLLAQRKQKNRFTQYFLPFLIVFGIAFLLILLVGLIFFRDSLMALWNQFLPDGVHLAFPLWNRTIAAFFILFCTFETFATVCHHFLRRKLAIQSLELKQQHSSESFLHLQSYLKQTSMLRHDIRHHFSVLRYYLNKGDIAEASSYLDELIRQEMKIVPYVQTANELINVLLNSWLLTVKEQNIDVRFQSLTAPAVLPASSPDICSLLSNLLENAKEACMKAPAGIKPFLSLEMSVKKDFFIISCKNSYYQTLLKNKKGHLISTKKHADSHGFGIYIMEKIAEKYNGFLDIQTDDSTFCATVALKLTASSGKSSTDSIG